MPSVTAHYNISSTVPFVDVDVSRDNRLFVDPHAVRLSDSPQPFAREALRCADTFFDEITRCVLSFSPVDRRHGIDLLQHFFEPWETRMGMAREGFRGHGGAEEIGQRIWDALTSDLEAFVRVGILKRLEDLAPFVEGIDRDITSDIATRIMFQPLVDYTTRMVEEFAELTAGRHTVQAYFKQAWDPSELRWVDDARVELPVVDGKPLLLVPKEWARPSLLLSAGRFYGTTVLGFAQMDRAVVLPNGKLLKTRKDDLRHEPGLGRGRSTNRRITLEALNQEHDLIAAHKRFVAHQWARANAERRSAA